MVCYALLNSSPIDELGDLCCQRFVGALQKIRGTTRKFHGKPVNMNQRCKRRSTSTVTLKELWWRNLPNPIPSVNRFLWGVGKVGCWIGKIGEQISDPQRSTELANCKYGSIRPRQRSAKISRAGNSKHGYYSSQATLDARGLLVRQRGVASERVMLVGERPPLLAAFSPLRDLPSRLRRSILSPLTRKKPLAPRVPWL